MRLRTAIPAGLIDTGAAALASFIVQAYAVRTFQADVLGVYALFFSAYLLASLTPQFLLLYPLEISSLQLPRASRIGLLHRSIRIVAVTPFFAASAALLASLLSPAGVSGSTLVRLALTSAAVSITAPFYEHLRRMMHISELSKHAATVGTSQLVLVIIAIGLMLTADVDPALIPFGALACSQAGAAAIGLGLIRRRMTRVELDSGVRALVHSGRWLLVSGVVPAAATFIAAALVSGLASAEDLGLAQAAHVASRPILVLATGLGAVLGFRMMEAGAAGNRRSGARHWKVYAAILLAGAGAYAAIAGYDWAGNPIAALLPRAYEVGGLVSFTIVANVFASLVKPPRDELIGARREPWVASIDSVGALAVVAVAGFSSALKSFAIPAGLLLAAVIHGVAYVQARRVLYQGFDDAGS